jgi:hypothetical protein
MEKQKNWDRRELGLREVDDVKDFWDVEDEFVEE